MDTEDDDDPFDGVARPAPIALDDAISLLSFLQARCGLTPGPIRLGRFEILRKLGAGAHGSVYLARDELLRRDVAIKVRRAPTLGREARSQFRREAQALASIAHPNIVAVFAHGESEFGTWIAMELVDGTPMSLWQKQQRSWREILGAYLQAGEGLVAAHAAGLVHRDVKPDNILVGADASAPSAGCRVRIADFGVADRMPSAASPSVFEDALVRPHLSGTAHASTERMCGGTPGYAAPEQAVEGRTSPRGDQFSFCVSLYEALFGQRPYTAQEIIQLAVDSDGVRSLRPIRGKVPGRVLAALRRGLAANPDARHRDMVELLRALRADWRPQRLAVLALPLAAVAGFSVPATRPGPCDSVATGLQGIWDDQRRATIQAGFSTDLGDAGNAAWPTVRERLDAYALAWSARREELCAASGAEDPDLQEAVACLARRRDQLANVASTLIDGDRRMRLNAMTLLDSVDAVTSCEPAGDHPVGPATDRRNAVAASLAAVDRSRTELAAGRYLEALAAADAAVATASLAEHDPTTVEASFARGRALDELGRDPDAHRELEYAAMLAEARRIDALAPSIWHALVRITAVDLHDPARAEIYAANGHAATLRIGGDTALLVEDSLARSLAASAEGREEEARTLLREAVAMLRAVTGSDDLLLASVLTELANTEARLDRGDASDILYREALEIRTKMLGADHPLVAIVEFDLGLNARERGAYESASNHFQRSLEIQESAYGPRSVRLAPVLLALAEMHVRANAPDAALPIAERAWAIQREELPRGHIDRGSAVALTVVIHIERKDLQSALDAAWNWAAELAPDASDEETSEVADVIGWLLCELDRCVEARPYYLRLQKLARTQRARAWADAGMGRVELASGNIDAAIVALERARAAVIDFDRDPELLAEIEEELARALAITGQTRRSRDMLRSAVARRDELARTNRSALDNSGAFEVP